MTRQLKKDTYEKKIGHYFREYVGQGSENIKFKIVTDNVVKANFDGFQEVENKFIAMVIKNESPEKTKICMTNVFNLMDTSIKSAKKHAIDMRNIRHHKNGLRNSLLNLNEVAILYAEIVKIEINPVKISLPHNSNGYFQIKYPKIQIHGNTYAEKSIKEIEPCQSNCLENSIKEIKQNSNTIKRLKGHCLDRTYISEIALLILKQFPDFDKNIKKLISHEPLDLDPFRIVNYCEEIKVNISTWEQAGQWIEYKEDVLSFRNIKMPESILTSLQNKNIDQVIEGIPYIGQSIIKKASNRKTYVMINRPRDNTGRNDAPTLRLKIENKIKTLRHFNIKWNEENIIHEAIENNNFYIQSLTGPFATKDPQKNLQILMEMAQQKGLL